ncbi:MAG: aspartate aminotransferase, partial [Anaerolineales bacterium]
SITNRNRQIILNNIETANAFFNQFSNLFHWHAPKAGSVALAKWLGKKPFLDVCQELLDQKGLMVLPGSVFDIGDNYFRLGLGRKTFADAINQFSDWLNSARGIY